jgi:hypothetical protein
MTTSAFVHDTSVARVAYGSADPGSWRAAQIGHAGADRAGLVPADELAAAHQEIAGLRAAITSNREIGIAVGILMSERKITKEQAFDLLRVASQQSNRKLRDLADDVVFTGTMPDGSGRVARPEQHRDEPAAEATA